MKKRTILSFTHYFLSLIFLFSCLWVESAVSNQVTLQLKWLHQAQFAGFYVAKEKGYYAKESLEVDFLEGGPGIDIAQSVGAEGAQFYVLSPEDILIKRSQGLPLTAIAAIYRRSAVVYLALPESGIMRPWDFKGKRVAILGSGGSVREFQFQFYAMMNNLGLDISDVKVVDYDPEYTRFCQGGVDVTAAYATGGLIKIQLKGYKPLIIWPGDYRVRFYSDILTTTDQITENNPDMVTGFLRASLKGWKDAVGDPEEAVAITLKYAEIKDKKTQLAMMEALLPLVHTGEGRIGWMEDERWNHMYNILEEQGIVKLSPEQLNNSYTLKFIKKNYEGNHQ